MGQHVWSSRVSAKCPRWTPKMDGFDPDDGMIAAMVALSHAAQAHGIVGNRVFPGTLAFDDPAVTDELILPAVSSLKHPGEGVDVTDNRIGGSFTRLLTSTVAFGIESGWMHRNWGPSQRWGSDTTTLGLKGLLYSNELHEVMISAGLGWGIGSSGAQGVSANNPDTLQPGIFSAKGSAICRRAFRGYARSLSLVR